MEIPSIEALRNMFSKESLESNMVFASFYITVYENLVATVTENIKSFLCDLSIENGELITKSTEAYRSLIKNRSVDEKGNKDVVKASFLWLVDNEAISHEDYLTFIQIKQLRNHYAHDLLEVLCVGITKEDMDNFAKLRNLYTKIDKWWINEIEIPTSGNFETGQYDPGGVASIANIFFEAMIDILYREKTDEYAKIINEYSVEWDRTKI